MRVVAALHVIGAGTLDEINHFGAVADSLAFTLEQMDKIDEAYRSASGAGIKCAAGLAPDGCRSHYRAAIRVEHRGELMTRAGEPDLFETETQLRQRQIYRTNTMRDGLERFRAIVQGYFLYEDLCP